MLSPVGQVAYCAANAFLDTYAFYKAAGNSTYTVSINWDSWQQVGMAVKALKRLSASYSAPPAHQLKIDHPLFDSYSSDDSGQAIFISRFRTDRHWVLDEHRILGKAVLPATAYLEMARAAFEHHAGHTRMEMREIYFLNPLMVEDGEQKEVHTILENREKGTRVAWCRKCDWLILLSLKGRQIA